MNGMFVHPWTERKIKIQTEYIVDLFSSRFSKEKQGEEMLYLKTFIPGRIVCVNIFVVYWRTQRNP